MVTFAAGGSRHLCVGDIIHFDKKSWRVIDIPNDQSVEVLAVGRWDQFREDAGFIGMMIYIALVDPIWRWLKELAA